MPGFLLRLRSPRPTFPGDMTEEERAVMLRHGEYLRGRARAGLVHAFGPVLDPAGAWGLALVEAADAAAAQALTEDDPVIQSGLGFSYEILPMASLVLAADA